MTQDTNTPRFSVKPIADLPKKKNGNGKRKILKNAPTEEQAAEINATLNSIYQEKGGALPNMKEIKIKKSNPFMKYLTIILVLGAIVSVAIWSGFFNVPSSTQKESVTLAIKGPSQTNFGVTTTYEIAYANKQDVGLKDITINVNYPAGFIFLSSSMPPSNSGKNEWKMDVVKANSSAILEITGKTYGLEGQPGAWQAFLRYQPENFRSNLQQSASFNSVISNSPFNLSISGPTDAVAGNKVSYAFSVKNSNGPLPGGLEIVPILPAEFTLSSSTPALGKNLRWIVPAATSTLSDTWTASMIGAYKDSPSTTPISGQLYLALNPTQRFLTASTSLNTELVKNDLSLNLAINGSTTDMGSGPGDMLAITIRIKNASGKKLKNAIVKLTFDAPSLNRQSVLDWKNISDQYDGNIIGQQLSDSVRRGQITWDSKKIPELALIDTNKEVNIEIKLPVKNAASIDFGSVKETAINASSEMAYVSENGGTESIAGSPVTVTLNSDLKFESRDTIQTDSNGRAEHKVSWILKNNFHSLKNISLDAAAYGDISIKADGQAPAGEVKIDQTAKTISWKIAEMPESMDVLSFPFTITINKENPSQSILLSKVKITAEDAVTGATLTILGDGISLTN